VESFDKHLKDEAMLSNNYYAEKAKFDRMSKQTKVEDADDIYDLNTN